MKKHHHDCFAVGLARLRGHVCSLFSIVVLCLLYVAPIQSANATALKEAPPNNSATQPRVYLATVPMVGMLIQDLLGQDAAVVVVSDTLDYHAPQVTPTQLRRLTKTTDIVWFGADFEPQMQGLVDKIGAEVKPRIIRLPVSSQPGAVQPFDQWGREHASSQASHDHAHDHGHDHASEHAHPWLQVETLKAWADFLAHTPSIHTPSMAQGPSEQARAETYDLWLRAFDEMILAWQDRFDKLDNRSFVQEHASLEPLAPTFDLMPIGSLTSQHDTSIGVRALWRLTKAVRQYNTQCFIAMPNSNVKLPPTLFSGTPQIHHVDPLGRSRSDLQYSTGYASVEFISNILAQIHACLAAPDVKP